MVDFYPKINVLGPYTPLFKGFGENLRFTAVNAPVLERKNQNPMQFFREKKISVQRCFEVIFHKV